LLNNIADLGVPDNQISFGAGVDSKSVGKARKDGCVYNGY